MLRTAFTGAHGLPLTPANVLGVLSVVFWALVIVVTLKYITLIMRADNHGEGGILALTALVSRGLDRHDAAPVVAGRLRHLRRRDVLRRRHDHAGDLGAVRRRGPRRSSRPALHPFVVPVDARHHRRAVRDPEARHRAASALFFGPVMCVWFVVLALLGVVGDRRRSRRSWRRSIRTTRSPSSRARPCRRSCRWAPSCSR